jgi:predicted RNA binding protein YcfA (HicA-like mRNA interferase family)
MKWSEIERIAIDKGWYLIRHGSEHDIYGHVDKKYRIQIERHKSTEVKRGLYYKLKKQIGF